MAHVSPNVASGAQLVNTHMHGQTHVHAEKPQNIWNQFSKRSPLPRQSSPRRRCSPPATPPRLTHISLIVLKLCLPAGRYAWSPTFLASPPGSGFHLARLPSQLTLILTHLE